MASFSTLLAKTAARTGRTPTCSDGKVTFGCDDGRARPVEVSPKVADHGPAAAMIAAALVPLAFTTKLQSEDKTSVSLSRTYKDDAAYDLAETFGREVCDDWPEGLTRAQATRLVELMKAGDSLEDAVDHLHTEEAAAAELAKKNAATAGKAKTADTAGTPEAAGAK